MVWFQNITRCIFFNNPLSLIYWYVFYLVIRLSQSQQKRYGLLISYIAGSIFKLINCIFIIYKIYYNHYFLCLPLKAVTNYRTTDDNVVEISDFGYALYELECSGVDLKQNKAVIKEVEIISSRKQRR